MQEKRCLQNHQKDDEMEQEVAVENLQFKLKQGMKTIEGKGHEFKQRFDSLDQEIIKKNKKLQNKILILMGLKLQKQLKSKAKKELKKRL